MRVKRAHATLTCDMWNVFHVFLLAFWKCKSRQCSNWVNKLLRKNRHYFSIVMLLKELSTPGKIKFAPSLSTEPDFNLIWTLSLVWQQIQYWSLSLPLPALSQLQGDTQAKLQRILQLISGAGLSMTNSHLLCGDFLYSGHTVMLTLTYLFIKECEYSKDCFLEFNFFIFT